MKWSSFYGMNSRCQQPLPASEGLSPPKGSPKRTARQKAKEQNTDLREFYLHKLSDFQSYHLVYVDEFGSDKRAGFERTGWSPLGVVPVQVSQFHCDERYQILPAYAQDGTITPEIAFHIMCIQSWFQTLERQDILFRIWLLPYCCLVWTLNGMTPNKQMFE